MRREDEVIGMGCGAIMLIGCFTALSAGVGEWLGEHYRTLPSAPLIRTGLGAGAVIVMGFGLVGTVIGTRRFAGWQKSWSSCPHGVAGGMQRNLCDRCLREKTAIEENYRRQRELEEFQDKVDIAASELLDNERARLAKILVPSIQELRRLTWQQFEDQVASMFTRLGYVVQQTPYVKDHGRDAILWKNGGKFLLECKKYAEGAVSGRRDLQILHSNLSTDNAVSGFFVTAGGFSKEAIEFARGKPIELVDGSQLVRLMFESKPASEDDSYRSLCRQCGAIVLHRLRAPRLERCSRGHDVAPTLDLAGVLTSGGAAPICECGAPMQIVRRAKRHFWGCTRYPECRRTRPVRPRWRSNRSRG